MRSCVRNADRAGDKVFAGDVAVEEEDGYGYNKQRADAS